jgi:hypothetical protein
MEHVIVKAAAAALREERTQIARVKPANLTYSVDEVPPLPLTIVMGLQHVFVMSVGWILSSWSPPASALPALKPQP